MKIKKGIHGQGHGLRQGHGQHQPKLKITLFNRLIAIDLLKQQVKPSMGLASYHIFDKCLSQCLDKQLQVEYLNNLVNLGLFCIKKSNKKSKR